jgi:hypothetical protein
MIRDPKRDRLLVFGGYNGARFADIWSYDLSSMSWEAVAAEGTPPIARHLHSAVYVPEHDGMLVFGGSVESGVQNETWFLRFAPPVGWERYQLSDANPPAVVLHSTAYDEGGRRMLIFGGFPNGMWEFHLGNVVSVDDEAGNPPHARPLRCVPLPAREKAEVTVTLLRSLRARAGLYVLRLSTGRESAVGKLLVVK